jgi:hypothetical protein
LTSVGFVRKTHNILGERIHKCQLALEGLGVGEEPVSHRALERSILGRKHGAAFEEEPVAHTTL